MDITSIPNIGEIFALLAPFSWAFAVILFRISGRTVGPVALNLFKNSLALILFVITTLVAGYALFPEGETFSTYLLLLGSGAVGIGLADMFFFMALNRVGAGLQAIIGTFYSPSIILLSVIVLGETLTGMQGIGVLLILSAVLFVSQMKGPGSESTAQILAGIGFGLLFALNQAVSIVMIKPQLEHWPLLWANSWRLLGGVITSAVVLNVLPQRRKALATLKNTKVWPAMIPAAVVGSYISLIFWLAGMKYTQASTASALNQTSTVWQFALAAILLHEPVTWKRLLGLVLGVGGVALVTFGG